MQPIPQNDIPDRVVLDSHRSVTQTSGILPNIKKSSHPCLALFYVLIKAIIVAVFLLLGFFINSLTKTEIVVILAAIDFWVTKNLAGRLLVGLRWWVDFDQQGEQHWRFECKVNEAETNAVNSKVFWYTLAFFTLVWIVLSLLSVLRLDIQNITICALCTSLLVFNLYWFYKCSKVQKENVRKLAAQYGTAMFERFIQGSIVANFI